MSIVAILAIVAALLLGLAIGWVGRGHSAGALAAECDDFREKFTRAVADLNRALGESSQLGPLREELATVRRDAAEAVARRVLGEVDRTCSRFRDDSDLVQRLHGR